MISKQEKILHLIFLPIYLIVGFLLLSSIKNPFLAYASFFIILTFILYIHQHLIFKIRFSLQRNVDFKESVKKGAIHEKKFIRWLTSKELASIKEELLFSSSLTNMLKRHPHLLFVVFKLAPLVSLLGSLYFSIMAWLEKGFLVGLGVFLVIFFIYAINLVIILTIILWIIYIYFFYKYANLYFDYRNPVYAIKGKIATHKLSKTFATQLTGTMTFSVRHTIFSPSLIDLSSILLGYPTFYLGQFFRKDKIGSQRIMLKAYDLLPKNGDEVYLEFLPRSKTILTIKFIKRIR